VSDITAIWNANAFFAYIFTLHFLGVKWEPRKLGAVILATVGVLAVVYGGSQTEMPEDDPRPKSPSSPATAPFVGDVLTLIASILYGLYQVLYKKYATPSTSQSESIESHSSQYQAIAVRDAEGDTIEELAHRSESNEALPFGLFANFLTGAVGLSTIIVLGLFIPILNALAIEEFRLVPNMHTAASIAAICMGGMVFNAGFMVSQM
jgi:drug/metabolite transporter (DMT)-like permease